MRLLITWHLIRSGRAVQRLSRIQMCPEHHCKGVRSALLKPYTWAGSRMIYLKKNMIRTLYLLKLATEFAAFTAAQAPLGAQLRRKFFLY